MKKKLEQLFANLIEKYGLSMEDEYLQPDICSITTNTTHRVCFDDELMGHLLAGNVSATTYNEMEERLAELGYEIDDTDGSTMTISTRNDMPDHEELQE